MLGAGLGGGTGGRFGLIEQQRVLIIGRDALPLGPIPEFPVEGAEIHRRRDEDVPVPEAVAACSLGLEDSRGCSLRI